MIVVVKYDIPAEVLIDPNNKQAAENAFNDKKNIRGMWVFENTASDLVVHKLDTLLKKYRFSK